MNVILVAVLTSALVSSIITLTLTKEIAAQHFKVIDGYVKEVVEIAKEQIKAAYVSRDRH